MILFPDYYTAFKCIADKCKHNCCTGWEIDIDDQTLLLYRSQSGNFGKRLADSIEYTDCEPHFKLCGEDERCPFLNESGLCDIITALGEDALCQICKIHPRFRNFYSFGEEIGLGLCCEEACRIILSHPKPFTLISDKTPCGVCDIPGITEFEQSIFKMRNDLSRIVFQEKSFMQKLEELRAHLGINKYSDIKNGVIREVEALEVLQNEWKELIEQCSSFSERLSDLTPNEEKPLNNLASYLFYRHLGSAQHEYELRSKACFCLFCLHLVYILCSYLKTKKGGITFDDITDICRMFSTELEYSEQNTSSICDLFYDV